MQDGTKAGEALSRAMDVLGSQDEIVYSEPVSPADRRRYADLPERNRKWPRPVRVIFIAGSAAALWGLIFAGIRLL